MRATRLKNLHVTRIDTVDGGASYDPRTGEGSHILLYKRKGGRPASADSVSATAEPKAVRKMEKAAKRARRDAKRARKRYRKLKKRLKELARTPRPAA
jgi:hypothetical protein